MVAFTLYLLVACWGFIGDSTTVVIESEDQTTFNAVLLSLDAQGLHLQQDSNARTLQLDEVASIQFSDPLPETASPATRWVELLDGTVIAANAVTCDGEELAVELPGIEKAEGELTIGPTVRFPTKLVRTLRFQELSAAQLPPWQQLTDVQRSLDGLILLRPEEKLDAIEGLVSEITSAGVQFEFSGQKIVVPFDKLAGVKFFSNQQAQQRKVTASVHDLAGNTWAVTGLSVKPAAHEVQLELLGGGEVKLPLVYLSSIAPQINSSLYLAELQSSQRTVADSSPFKIAIPGADMLLGPQAMEFQLDDSRVAIPSIQFFGASTLTYRVPDGYSRLAGAARLTPHGDRATPCDAQLFVENKLVWETKLKRIGVVEPFEIAVQPGQRLKLVVESASTAPLGNSVVWEGVRLLQ